MTAVFDAARDAAELDRVVVASPEVRSALARFCALVAEWDAKTDLTGAKDARSLAEILCLDAGALAAEPFVPHGARVVDVGSGAGTPILPLLLLRSDLVATLVEPRRKRVAFLRTAIGALRELRGRATVVEAKVDPAAPSLPGMPFDVAIAKATFPPAEWLPIGLRLAKRAIVLTVTDELPAPPDAPVVARVDYVVPSSGAKRHAAAYAYAR